MKKINKIYVIMVASILCNAIFLVNVESTNLTIQTNMDSESINVLVIIPDRFGANTFFNLDNMELFGWNVTLTGLTEIVQPCPWAHSSLRIPELQVDILINDIADISFFDVLAIMPANWRSGEAYGDLLDDAKTLNLISSANENNLVIWATCAGVRVLAAADVLNGVKVTGRIQFKSEYENAGAIYLGENIPPVIDQNIVTCMRGQYWNKENIEAIATALEQSIVLMMNKNEINEQEGVVSCSSSNGLWTKTYGGPSADGGKTVYAVDDETYLVIGYTYSSGTGASDIYVVHIDKDGSLLWSKTYGGSGWEYGHGICEASDVGFILVGYSTSNTFDGSKDVYAIKIDADGNEIWSKTFGGNALDIGRSVCPADDGYIICGYTESFGSGENDVYLIKIDETGNVLWEKQFGGAGAELGYQIKQTFDGNYVIVGASGSDRPNYDCYILKIARDGTTLWENFYGASGGEGGYDRGHAVIETTKGDFLVVGESNYGDALNMFVVKTDSDGNEVWSQVYGKSLHDHGSDIVETADGNYVICGRFDRTEKGMNDIGLIKINDNGEEIWGKTISMYNSEWATSIIETDSGFLMTGHSDSIGSGSYDMFIMKLDSEGNSNQQPDKPSPPIGPTSGRINEPQTYSAVAEDPDDEDIYYLFDWGDGTDSDWLGPYTSGEACEASKTWDTKGDYQIKVKAKDINGGESDWSDSLSVSMPKNKLFCIFLQLFEKSNWIFPFINIYVDNGRVIN